MRTLASFISPAWTASTRARTVSSTGRSWTRSSTSSPSASSTEADTLGFGRATYEHMAAYWPTDQAQANDPAITSRKNTKPKLVFSTALEHAGWSNTTVITGEAVEQMETVKAAPGGELLVLGSAHLTAHFAAAGVLDELRIMVCPIALGQGRSLFEDLKGRLALRLAHVRQFDSGNVLLTYRPSPWQQGVGGDVDGQP